MPWLYVVKEAARGRTGESPLFRDITELEVEEGPLLSLYYH